MFRATMECPAYFTRCNRYKEKRVLLEQARRRPKKHGGVAEILSLSLVDMLPLVWQN